MPHKALSLFRNAALLVLAAAGLSVGSASSVAQTAEIRSTVPARIVGPIKEERLVTLRGNTHPLAASKYDQGRAPASLQAKRMLLVLKRSPQQDADLKAYLSSLQDKSSPNYHKFLTPEKFGALYGPADSDIQAVSGWMRGHGFAVSSPNKAKTVIEFSGTVSQLEEAFHTSIRSYLVKGEQHYANASDPQIPAALTPVVAGVAHMNNFFAKSQAIHGPRGKYDPATKTFKPELTAGSGTNSFLYVGPSDAATIYNSPLTGLNKNFAGGTNYDGTGVTIGVAGESNIDLAGVASYRKLFGLAPKVPTVIVDGDDPGEGDIYFSAAGEALLDVEIASGMAPGADVNLYVSNGTALQQGLDFAILRALGDNSVSILNVSFGLCEAFSGTSGNALNLNEWEEAAAQGISVTVSTGDSGSAGCDNPNTETIAVNGLNVNGLASTPYNIAVGGTDYDVLFTNFSGYVGSSNSAPYEGTAKKYIPENPWNNSTDNNTTVILNTPYTDSSGDTNIVGGGGGASSCTTLDPTGSTCTGAYAKPTWQKLFDNGDGVRDLPDVSMFASNGFYGATWAICAKGNEGGSPVDDCQVDTSGTISSITGFGGTSAAAPAFAGVLAIVSQKTGERLGQATDVLYTLAKQKPSVFHDVTVGNNSVPCAGGSADCGTNHFLTGYDTKTGFDLATGLGSVDVSALVSNWNSVTFAPSTTVLTLNKTTFVHGTNVAVGIDVTSAGQTPSGDVSLVDDLNVTQNPNNARIGAFTLNSSGKVSATSDYLPGGTYNVIAHYAGDGVVGPSDSNPVPVVVTPENSTVSFQFAAYDPSTGNQFSGANPPYGFYSVLDAFPGGADPQTTATGTVKFTNPGLTPLTEKVNSEGFAELFTTFVPVGNQTVTAAYSGDKSFNPSTGTAAITVVKGTTTTSSAPASQTVAATASARVNVVIESDSLGNAPTGTVTFKSGSTTVGSATVIPRPATSSALAGADATGTIAASALATGANTIIASYSGDANYAASTSTAVSITVMGGAAASFTLSGTPVTIAKGSASGTSTVTVTPAGGYTGTVNLKCALTSAFSGTNVKDAPTCSIGNATITSGPATVTMTINDTASSALHLPVNSPFRNGFGWAAAGGTALACVVFFGIPARRRGWKAMLTLAIFAAMVSFASGCGTSGKKGTPAGSYIFAVTGADSKSPATLTGATTVTVTIQ